MTRHIAALIVAVLALVVIVTHERPTDAATVLARARETIDIGTDVVAVLDADTRVSYVASTSILRGRHVTIEQHGGRAIYRVPAERRATIHSANGALELSTDEPVVVVVEGARFASTSSRIVARELVRDESLVRALDERGQDPRERLVELHAMRDELQRERELSPPRARARLR
jgi:hypothetical protein